MSQANAPPSAGWNEKLQDGTAVWIRPIDRQDAELELEFLEHLSPEFRSLRFLGLVQDPSPDVARELVDLDRDKAVGFMAVISHDGRQRQIGAAHFHADTSGDHCDLAVTVSQDWQRRGVGLLLMRHLIDAARARGIRNMHARAPAYSDGSHHLAANLGFERCQDLHDPAAMIYDLALR